VARILLQTTIVDTPDDWNVERFSLLAEELRRRGHDVTSRNHDKEDADSVLSALDNLDFDQLWLLAVDTGSGLSAEDAAGILRFRDNGGGVLTARDHQDLGCSLMRLGSLGRFNHFHHHNPESDASRDDLDNPDILWPNFHSGANGDYQPVFVDGPVHQLLRTDRTASGHVEWFPAHPHEGSVSVPEDCTYACVVGRGRSMVTGRYFNLAVAVDGEMSDGRRQGRALVCSTFHHFADLNWDVSARAPSFVTDLPGHEIEQDPQRLDIFKDYIRNIAGWLG
jgi:hypothetical protein